jgi:hypothetical protein
MNLCAATLQSWLFHPLAAMERAASRGAQMVKHKLYAVLRRAAGLPDPHGRHS